MRSLPSTLLPLLLMVGAATAGTLDPLLSLRTSQPLVDAVVLFRHEGPPTRAAMEAATLKGVAALDRDLGLRPAPDAVFWLGEAAALRVSPASLDALAAHPLVERVSWNAPVRLPRAWPLPERRNPDGPWTTGLRLVGVDTVRATWGLTGKGVRLGIIDTGADGTHPDLRGRIVAYKDLGSTSTEPTDKQGHGTHAAGTMVGGAASGTAIGVAPGADLVVARALVGFSQLTSMLASMQWMADPDGNPATKDAPALVNCSWHTTGDPSPFYRAIENLDALGTMVCFAAGNDGEEGLSMPHEHPAGFAVGAVGDGGSVCSFSARGPAVYLGTKLQKPEVTAPGDGVWSSLPEGKYGWLSGTSMAAPHVSGLVALMLEADPTLTTARIRSILTETARSSSSGWDRAYGWGVVDAPAAIRRVLADTSAESEGSRVIVLFRQGPALRLSATEPAAPEEVLTGLQARQANLEAQLRSALTMGGKAAPGWTSLWVAGALALRADPALVAELEAHPSVLRVIADRGIRIPETSTEADRGAPVVDGLPWGLRRTGVDRVWRDRDLTGRGVTVGHVDTGVDGDHEALRGRVAGWFDPTGTYARPTDPHGHGTHTAGTIVGGADGEASGGLGVAPGARLLVARGLTGENSYAPILASLQWMLDPDGNPATRDEPRVVSCSWHSDGDEADQEPFYRAFAALAAAGILPVFSAGNTGTIGIPHPVEHPATFAVAAVKTDDWLAPFSARGPAFWQGEKVLKPDLAGPGTSVLSAKAGGGTELRSGTSMAAPHVAGVAALLLEARPSLTALRLRELLAGSSHDLGPEGWDGGFGQGLLDAAAAVDLLLN